MKQSKKTKFGIGFISTKIIQLYKNRSMSTQLIFTIVMIFLSFFSLQLILNFQFFQDFYTEQEFDKIHAELLDYRDDLNDTDANYFDVMYEYTSNNDVYSVITDRAFKIQSSEFDDYTINVTDENSLEIYTFLVPENTHIYEIDENVSIEAYVYTNHLYSPVTISGSNLYIYNNGIQCDENCITVNGTITEINKPLNLNYKFENTQATQEELTKLSSHSIDLLNIQYSEGYWYTSTSEGSNKLVFIHELGTFEFIITIIPIQDTTDIISIVNSYNYFVYLTAIAIIFIWSFRLTRILSKPVQNIEAVAREIAALNFNVEAHEYNNRENTSLSKSVNLIAKNLKETLDAISAKNDELRTIYDEQTKQVSLKKQLVSSISHELKTPLMIMQVTIQGILDGIVEEEDQVKELNNVIEEINKSSIMIQDMLQIYRLEDANTQLEISEFNLSELVYFFINDFENILKNHDFKLDINLDSSIFIEADNKLIKRCISNFFTNAIRYTPDGERIYLEVSESEDFVYFELTNYGVNIPEEDLENIWIPFFRGQSEISQKLKTKGSGIGLYLVSEVLKAHEAEFNICNIKNGVKAYFKLNKKAE